MHGIGMGIPGTMNAETGEISFAPNLGLNNVNLGAALEQEFNIPVYSVQDTRAAAWAEYLVGKGKGMSTIMCVTLGTGIGCGIIINGAIYQGPCLSFSCR